MIQEICSLTSLFSTIWEQSVVSNQNQVFKYWVEYWWRICSLWTSLSIRWWEECRGPQPCVPWYPESFYAAVQCLISASSTVTQQNTAAHGQLAGPGWLTALEIVEYIRANSFGLVLFLLWPMDETLISSEVLSHWFVTLPSPVICLMIVSKYT